MKTNDQLETLIQNLVDRMNRIEAMQAVQTTASGDRIVIDIDTSAVAKSIAQLENALNSIEARKLVTLNGK